MTPLPVGPSGKSRTLTLPASRWNDPIHSLVRLRQCPINAMWIAGWPTTINIFSSSDSSESSLNRDCQAFSDWCQTPVVIVSSYSFNQPGWRAETSVAACRKQEETDRLHVNQPNTPNRVQPSANLHFIFFLWVIEPIFNYSLVCQASVRDICLYLYI